MPKNLFLVLSEIIMTFCVLVATNHSTLSKQLKRQVKLIDEDFRTNDTELINESEENDSASTVNGTLFWMTEMAANEMDINTNPDEEHEGDGSFVTEENIKEQSSISRPAITEPITSADVSVSQDKNYEIPSQFSNDSFQIYEKIILPRNNCNAHIAVQENSDTKLTIKFGHLQNNSYGRCCLTLSGHQKSMLGVLISNVHLYRTNTQGEVLKVIVGDHYSAFVLKEYYGSRDYEPLLLTETHKVYLVLYYKVEYADPNQNCTYFNLEVFTYH